MLLLGLISGSLALLAQDSALDANRFSDPVIEKKVSKVLDQMTLEEKVAMCVGVGNMGFSGVPRLGIPTMVCEDGPRGPHGGFTTAFPVGVAFGSTWNPELIGQAAEVMGEETRALGVNMLLGPGLNIQRDPLGGRFFEYYTEDPFLNSRLVVAYVKGVQSKNVAACLKHFVCNNREDNRNEYMSMVDERTLNEIYLPGFKAAVQEAGAWAVMTAANGLNGDYCSDSKHLLHDILKQKWGFDGMVLTDWLGTRSTEKAAFAGLDVAMPHSDDSKFGAPLLYAVKNGDIPEAIVADKARRVLRTMARVGLLDGVSPKSGGVLNTREHFEMSRRVAEESLVLLKNVKQTLPLDAAKMRKLVVVGPNADQRFCLPGLGGSSWQFSPYEITPLRGIRNALGTNAAIQYFSSDDLGDFKVIPSSVMQEQNGAKGFFARYYNAGDSTPAVERIEPELSFLWEMRSPDLEKIQPEQFRAQFVGSILPPATGIYTLRVTSGAGSASLFGDREGTRPLAFSDAAKGIPSAIAQVQMQKGKPFFVRIEYSKSKGDGLCRLEWTLPMDDKKCARLMAAASEADAVLVFAGINNTLDTEGRDRTDMKFPSTQQALIRQLAAANPRTVVTLLNGSPLELAGWIDQVPAVLEAWYPGMEGGTAIANVLFGKVNPSGKLPFTWPKRAADSPTYAVGTQNNDRVDYKEGIFVGYRYFDTKNIEPQFPFGYGLSYTTFDYKKLKLSQTNGVVTATLAVENNGKVAGAEVVQLYVRELNPVIERPIHELKAFKKVQLAPGETKELSFDLGPSAFSYFSPASGDWALHPGRFEIQAGSSSRDIRQKETILIPSAWAKQAAVHHKEISAPDAPTGLAVERVQLTSWNRATATLRWTPSTKAAFYYNVYQRNPDKSLAWLGATPNCTYDAQRLTQIKGQTNTPIEVEAVAPNFGVSLPATAQVDWTRVPPSVITDTLPTTATAMTGDQITFSSVFGSTHPMTYQWQVIAGGRTKNIRGATNTTLTLTNLQPANTAAYRLQGSNDLGIAFSTPGLLTVFSVPVSASNIITSIAAQTGLQGVSFTPSWPFTTNNSLIAGQSPSSSSGNFNLEPYLGDRSVNSLTSGGNLTIFSIGSPITTSPNYVTCGDGGGAGSSLIYTLTGSTSGYDLTNIVVYGGWGDNGRDQQAYTVYYSTITAPTNFIALAWASYNPPSDGGMPSATRVSLTPASHALAANVAAVKFDFTSPPSKNGYCGYSKIELFGSVSAPLPTTPGDGKKE